MKRIMIMTLLLGSLMATGCYLNTDVDLDVNTDRYALNICSVANYRMNHPELGYVPYYEVADTAVFGATIPQLAFRLALNLTDSSTIYWIDQQKQSFLPSYVCTLVDSDTTQPDNYAPLLAALMAQGLLRADTSYKPMLLLEIYDPARFRCDSSAFDYIDDEGDTMYYYEFLTANSIVHNLRVQHHMPVRLAPGVDPSLHASLGWLSDDWPSDSLRLDSIGVRIVPDPQGRQMRIIEFNRCKGKI